MSELAVLPADDPSAFEDPSALLLLPTDPEGGVCGAVLVPEASSRRARLNGIRLGGGLHVVRHGDRVDLGARSAWFAVAAEPDRVIYDPELHGERLFCLRTKAQLKPGDAIVVCAGTPDQPCGMKYKASAWVDTMACHHCGAVSAQTTWTPPAPTGGASLERLLLLARRGDE
jgi:hypothetical protein